MYATCFGWELCPLFYHYLHAQPVAPRIALPLVLGPFGACPYGNRSVVVVQCWCVVTWCVQARMKCDLFRQVAGVAGSSALHPV